MGLSASRISAIEAVVPERDYSDEHRIINIEQVIICSRVLKNRTTRVIYRVTLNILGSGFRKSGVYSLH